MPRHRTGSSEGIGRAIALLFSYEGAHVVCADIHSQCGADNGHGDAETEIDTHLYIRNTGANAFFVRTDVSVSADIQNLVQATVEEYGRLDMYAQSRLNHGCIFVSTDRLDQLCE